MKILPPSEYDKPNLELSSVLMTSEDLVDLCSRIERLCGSVSISKKQPDGAKIVYETIEEISNHAPSINVPFSIESDGPTIAFTHYGVRISYSKPQESAAKTIFSLLKVHSPIVLNYPVRSMAALLGFGIFFASIVKFLGDVAPIDALPNLYASNIIVALSSMIGFGLQVYVIPGINLAVRVVHRRKDTFLQRHKDRIIVSIFSILLGGVMTYIANPLLAGFTKAPP